MHPISLPFESSATDLGPTNTTDCGYYWPNGGWIYVPCRQIYARDLTTGYIQITTRNNFQIRLIEPKDCPEVLRRIQDAGIGLDTVLPVGELPAGAAESVWLTPID